MGKRITTVVFTVAVTVVFVSPISLMYLVTRDTVALNEEVFLKRAVLYAAGIPLPAAKEDVVALFTERVESAGDPGSAPKVFRIKAEGSDARQGVVLLRTGPGLWGEITMAVGLDSGMKRLTGVDFLQQSETPGLGARISESWFKEQFRGKAGPFSTVGEGEPAKENEFDAITGASITSNAVKAILNDAIAQAGSLAP